MADEETTENEAPEETPAEAPETAAPEAAAPAEPVEQLSPKERRQRARAKTGTTARPSRTIEERAQERAEARKRKAAHRRAYRAKVREKAAASGPATPAPVLEAEPTGTGRAKTRQGIVMSDKADKTITVRIDMARRHRTYKKIVRTSTMLHVHDEANDAHVGDTVRVVESRPLSRLKRWRLVEILERAR